MYARTDKVFRLKNRILSRIKGLESQARLHHAYNNFDYMMYFVDDYEACISTLYILLERLVINTTICNDSVYFDVYHAFLAYPATIQDHAKHLFGGKFYRSRYVGRKNPLIDKFLENFKVCSLSARRRDLESLLRLELNQRLKEGWFVVFNTLTIDKEYLKEVFDARATAWTDYIRSVDRAVGISAYGTWSQALTERTAGREFHTYFAVVERGTVTGHLHLHVLHIMRVLPQGSFDPNKGLIQPYKREIDCMKGFWKYGYSAPIAVRFSNSDAFGQGFWRWPVKKVGKDYIPLPCKEPEAIIAYISKYISKELDKQPTTSEVIPWRVRKSRNLGKVYLSKVVELATEDQLKLIMISNGWILRMREKSLPVQMLKLMSLRKLCQIWMQRNSLSMLKSIKGLSPRENILKQLVSLLKGRSSLSMNTGSSRLLNMLSMEGSNLAKLFDDVANLLFRPRGLKFNCSTYTGGIL